MLLYWIDEYKSWLLKLWMGWWDSCIIIWCLRQLFSSDNSLFYLLCGLWFIASNRNIGMCYFTFPGWVTLWFKVVEQSRYSLITPRLEHIFLSSPFGVIPTHTLPLSQEETNIVLVEKYRHPGRALFIVYFTVKTWAIVSNKQLRIVDWRHRVHMSSNSCSCSSTAMCNILTTWMLFSVKTHCIAFKNANNNSKICLLTLWRVKCHQHPWGHYNWEGLSFSNT